MKRFLVALLALVMVFAVVGCNKPSKNEQTPENSPEMSQEVTGSTSESAFNSVLNKVWGNFAEDKKFPAMGGDMANMVDGKAGKFNLSEKESAVSTLHISAEAIDLVAEAESLIHAMNANTFTSASFKLKDAKETENFVSSLKESINGTQWMCGFPEKYVIFTTGDNVFYALGNGELVDTFKANVEKAYGSDAKVVAEENIA